MRAFSDAYNACLSITLLPVEVARLTAIPGEYFFKAGIPVLFAAAPVMIFRAARTIASQRVAVLSAAVIQTIQSPAGSPFRAIPRREMLWRGR